MYSDFDRCKSLVLFDDDPVFCNLLSHVSQAMGVPLDYYDCLLEMGSIYQMTHYQAAIVDYDLGAINGIELAEYIPSLLGDMPLLLISAHEKIDLNRERWPNAIVQFLHKKNGPEFILHEAMKMLPEAKSQLADLRI